MNSFSNNQKNKKPQATTVNRRPPQNLDAEIALLGSIMLRPGAIHEIVDLIRPDCFYAHKHQLIYQAMLELFEKNDPVDLVTVTNRLREKNDLDLVGGQITVAELANSVPSSANIRHYADLVLKKDALRSLIQAGEYLTQLGFEEDSDLEQVLDQAEKHIFSITSGTNRTQKFVGIKELLPTRWDAIEKLHGETGGLRGVPTGFKDLDIKLSGLQNSDLIILAARPSMGKTSLSLDIARQASVKHKIPVGYFSLEMSSDQLVDRMLAAEARVDLWKMRTGKQLTENDFESMRDAMARLSAAPLFIDDQAGNSLLRMRSTARRMKSEHNLGLIVVDYLQLIMPTKNYDNMVNQITEISRALKALARELEVPVLALSQLSRAVESRGGKPRLSDLRDSGAIEQDADVVIFIHREKDEEEGGRSNQSEILIEKHRNGATGKVDLYFDGSKATFMDIDNDHENSYKSNATGSSAFGQF